MQQDGRPSILPSPPHLAAGAFGGPLVIVSLTPLRNAMSNAAQDRTASFVQLFAKVGGRGAMHSSLMSRVATAYTGAAVSALPACPQWCVIGPAFHAFHAVLPTPLALLATAHLETFIAYGSQSRNAQLAYNVQVAAGSSAPPGCVTQPIAPSQLTKVWQPWGPGAAFFALRNACGMAGIRWLSPPCQAFLEPVMPTGPREVCSDMAASMVTCVASAPLNACWAYVVTTPELWTKPTPQCLSALLNFLKRQRRHALRDFSVRCVYISSCFTMFSAIERLCVATWPK